MLNAAQIHLALNHFPIAGIFFGLLFLSWGLLRKTIWAQQAGLVLFLMSGIAALPVFFSGEDTEEMVEHKPGVTEHLIHEHEEAAELAFYVTLVTAVAAFASLLLISRKMKFAKHLVRVSFFLGIVSAALLANAAHQGGMIRHDELRSE